MCYDRLAPLYTERGYRVVPIAPGTKAPHYWNGKRYLPLTSWTRRPPPQKPQPGAGIGVVCGRDIVGLDFDCDGEMFTALQAALPDSPVSKIGNRGATKFFWAPGCKSRRFKIGGKIVFEILGVGRQTVIPDSIHPDTREPYIWTSESLLDVDPARDLPRLPKDVEQRIEKALEPFGYVPEPIERVINPNGFEGPHGELNILALTDLTKWVPELGLLRYRRRRGAAASYEAVATWRASNTARELAKRDLNLKISPLGIKDFGDDRGYSPLDLVMAARGVSLSEAVAWLDARLGWSTGGPEIVVEAPAAEKRREHPQAEINSIDIREEAYTGGWAAPPEEPEPDGDAAQQAADDTVLKAAGAWLHGDSLPTLPECSFEGFLPKAGAGLLVGQLGCCKTHVLVDFAVAMADPAAVSNFAGRKRVRRGGVVLIDFEDSSAPLRIACAAKHRGVPSDTLLPLLVLPTAPPILRRKKINSDAVKWYRTVLGAADRLFQRRFGLRLGAVAVDPLIDAADFDNEQDNAETNRAMLAFDGLGRELGCLFVVADHAGKDISKGARGGSAKGGKARFILNLPEKVANHAEHRTLTVKKQRNLPDGWGVELWFELVEIQSADGKTATNLAACWGAEGQGEDDQDETSDGVRLPRLQLAALGVLRELVTAVTPSRGEQVAWVSLEAWYAELINQTIIEPDNFDRRKVFKRVKDGLRDKRAIKIHGEKVCIPL